MLLPWLARELLFPDLAPATGERSMRSAVMGRRQRFATASGRGGAADWKKANNKPYLAKRAHSDRAKLAADRWPPNAWSRGRLDKGGRVEPLSLSLFMLWVYADDP